MVFEIQGVKCIFFLHSCTSWDRKLTFSNLFLHSRAVVLLCQDKTCLFFFSSLKGLRINITCSSQKVQVFFFMVFQEVCSSLVRKRTLVWWYVISYSLYMGKTVFSVFTDCIIERRNSSFSCTLTSHLHSLTENLDIT